MFPYKLDYNSSSYLGLIYYIRNTTNHANSVTPTVSSIHPVYRYLGDDQHYKVINGISETFQYVNDSHRWVSNGTNYQWYQLDFKNFKIALTGYYLVTYRGHQKYFQIMGSNDGINFDLIENTTVNTIPENNLTYVNISNSNWYSTFRVMNVGVRFEGGNNIAFDLYRIELFGYVTKEYICSVVNSRTLCNFFIGYITPFILQ